MSAVLLLRIVVEPAGWRLHLGAPTRQPRSGHLPAAEVTALTDRIAALLRPPVVVQPGRVDRRRRAEDDAGQALTAALAKAGLAQTWGELLGQARATEQAPLLVIDCDDPAVRRLPWELAAAGPGQGSLSEALGGAVIRLARGSGTPHPPAPRLRALLWCPTPEDPACQRARAALSPQLAARGIPQHAVPAAPAPETADVLVVIAHGALAEEGGMLSLGETRAAPGTLAALLGDLLPRVGAVMLGVCEGGAPSHAPLQDLAGRLLLAGAPAVVAPAQPVSPDAFADFAAATLGALHDGAGVVGAVERGRSAVQRRLDPHPDSRPAAYRLLVSSLEALHHPGLRRGGWWPPEWPRHTGELRDLLARAAETARERGRSWVGVEHVLLAWRPGDGGTLSQRVGRAVTPPDAALLRGLEMGFDTPPADTAPVPTPRLSRIVTGLPPGAGIDALWRALVDDTAGGIHALSAMPLAQVLRWGTSTGSLTLTTGPAVPARSFEVVWGPEDGRRLTLAPGETLGRHAAPPRATRTLYATAPARDAGLRSCHLRYDSPGHVTLLRRAQHLPAGLAWTRHEPVRGPLPLTTGDLLLLSPSTWLRALG